MVSEFYYSGGNHAVSVAEGGGGYFDKEVIFVEGVTWD
jgi:hypothetical protein